MTNTMNMKMRTIKEELKFRHNLEIIDLLIDVLSKVKYIIYSHNNIIQIINNTYCNYLNNTIYHERC